MKSALALAREAVELAEKATPGEWSLEKLQHSDHNIGVRVRGQHVSGYAAFLNTRWLHEPQRQEQRANAELIAHAGTSYATVARAAIEMAAELKLRPSVHTPECDVCNARNCSDCRGVECSCGKAERDARIDALTKET